MGIKRRLVWIVVGLFFCWLCTGCRKGETDAVLTDKPEKVLASTAEPAQQSVPELTSTMVPANETESIQQPDSEPTPTFAPTMKPDLVQQSVAVPTAVPTIKPDPVQQSVATPTAASTIKPDPVQQSVATPTAVPTIKPDPVQQSVAVPTAVPTIKPQPTQQAADLPQETTSTIPQATTQPATELPLATAAPHVHTVAVEEQDATCLGAGWSKEYCISCGIVMKEENTAALGHDFIKSVWELPTCTKGGYYNNICSRCGQVECVMQEPSPHEVEDILVQEGNCMEDTVIRHVCKICGIQVREETRYTPYDKHLLVTEQLDGAEITYCEHCGVVQ